MCALAVASGIGACGSSSTTGVSPAAYDKSICTAVGPFERDIAARAGALDLTKIKSAAEGKSALQGFLGAIAADTTTAVSELKGAGTPNVRDGTAIQTAIVSAFSKLETTLGAAASQAKSLPTGSPQAFKTAATTLGASVKNSMGGISASLSGLKSPALESAAHKVSACESLNAAG